MNKTISPVQVGIFFAGLIMLGGADYNLIATAIVTIIALWPKPPARPPCKIFDFAEEKAKRTRQPIAFKKAA